MLSLDVDYHVHANYNDHSASNLTITNVIRKAEEKNLKRIAFTEHVRKTSEWIERYIEEIESVKDKTDLDILTGFEAKILRDGEIDCLSKYQDYFIIASFHTKYNDKTVWINALKNAIKNSKIKVIGHLAPEETFILEVSEIEDIADLIINKDKIIELNAKYRRPPIDWLKIFKKKGVKFHLGSDAHSLDEVGNFSSIKDLIDIANH